MARSSGVSMDTLIPEVSTTRILRPYSRKRRHSIFSDASSSRMGPSGKHFQSLSAECVDTDMAPVPGSGMRVAGVGQGLPGEIEGISVCIPMITLSLLGWITLPGMSSVP